MYHAMVDDDMYDILSQFKWHPTNGGYPSMKICMHNLILKLKNIKWGDKVVDHIDCDKANNLVSNFRAATKRQNGWNKKIMKTNTSGYKGVRKMKKKWAAYCGYDFKQTQIGTFETAEDAAKAWDMHARKVYGEFANCNFPPIGPEEEARIQALLDNPKKLKGESRYLGVSPHQGRWAATAYANSKKIYLGLFDTEKEAALAFNKKVKEMGLTKKINKIID